MKIILRLIIKQRRLHMKNVVLKLKEKALLMKKNVTLLIIIFLLEINTNDQKNSKT